MADDRRILQLTAFFHKVINNQRDLSSSRDGKLFLEALCAQPDPPACAHKLISALCGLSSLQASFRFDTSVSFLNDHAVSLLRYFQNPDLKSISSGSVLAQLLLPLIDPPFFWDAFTNAFLEGELRSEACQAFAWLLLQLVSQPGKESSSFVVLAQSSPILKLLSDSSDGETRNLGQKIKHALPLDASELHLDAEARPGGRHDNDHQNFRDISIMPTADELLSKDRPFFRTADFIEDPNIGSARAAHHLDNQFRLLREDMLGEIREELKIVTGAKSGRHRGITVNGLKLAGTKLEDARGKPIPWGVVFEIPAGVPQLKKLEPSKIQKCLEDNRHILRHGSMACLIIGDEPVAFPTIHRDLEELSKSPPTITLQFADDATMSKALVKMKTSDEIKLVQLDTAVFAYEPFLNQLQKMIDVPLRDEILDWVKGQSIPGPTAQLTTIIKQLQERSGKDLKSVLGLVKSVTLDDSQMESLRSCLTQRVSLIQGPPGQ